MINKTQTKEAAYELPTDDSKFIDKRRTNTKSDLIEITEDKLENILLKHLDKLSTKKAWLVPFSIFVSVLIANLTSDFKDRLGLPGTTWEAVYLIISFASGIWCVLSLVRSYATKDKCTISELIAVIKNAEPKKSP